MALRMVCCLSHKQLSVVYLETALVAASSAAGVSAARKLKVQTREVNAGEDAGAGVGERVGAKVDTGGAFVRQDCLPRNKLE
jgi:hypothetical protein